MAADTYTSPSISLETLDRNFRRADIEFRDVDHSGASFDAHVFLNNPEADENTNRSLAAGYAGSFSIFGHGGCFGDIGHCDVRPRRLYDPRPSHPLTPTRKVVIASDGVRRALEQGGTVVVTVVPVVTSWTEKCDTQAVLRFGQVRIITYR